MKIKSSRFSYDDAYNTVGKAMEICAVAPLEISGWARAISPLTDTTLATMPSDQFVAMPQVNVVGQAVPASLLKLSGSARNQAIDELGFKPRAHILATALEKASTSQTMAPGYLAASQNYRDFFNEALGFTDFDSGLALAPVHGRSLHLMILSYWIEQLRRVAPVAIARHFVGGTQGEYGRIFSRIMAPVLQGIVADPGFERLRMIEGWDMALGGGLEPEDAPAEPIVPRWGESFRPNYEQLGRSSQYLDRIDTGANLVIKRLTDTSPFGGSAWYQLLAEKYAKGSDTPPDDLSEQTGQSAESPSFDRVPPAEPGGEERILHAELSGTSLAPGEKIHVDCRLLLAGSATDGGARTGLSTDPQIPHAVLEISTTGFRKVSSESQRIKLERGKDSEAAPFTLQSVATSGHSITIAVFQDRIFKGELLIDDPAGLLPGAKPAGPDTGGNPAQGSATAPMRDPDKVTPDLTIILDSLQDEIRISSPRHALDCERDKVGRIESGGEKILQEVRDAVAKIYRGQDPNAREDPVRAFKILGDQVRSALPDDLIAALADPRVELVWLKIGVDADFPIELCLLGGKGGQQLLCEKAAVMRWYVGAGALSNVGRFPVHSVAFIIGKLNLGFTSEEQSVLANCKPGVTRAATRKEVLDRVMKATGHGLIHFKGHISLGAGSTAPGISLADGNILGLNEIGVIDEEKAAFRCEPVVFLNGCDSTLPGKLIGGSATFPYRFCKLDATAFIGTMWEVDEDAASEFSRDFYRLVREDVPVVHAVRLAREALARQAADPANGLKPHQRLARHLAARAYAYFGPCDLRIDIREEAT